jgi:hypothetical protein
MPTWAADAGSKLQPSQTEQLQQPTTPEDAMRRGRSRFQVRTPVPRKIAVGAQGSPAAMVLSRALPARYYAAAQRSARRVRSPVMGKLPNCNGDKGELAGQVLAGQTKDTFNVKSLRKQIDQVGLFDLISQAHQGPQIPGQGRWIA